MASSSGPDTDPEDALKEQEGESDPYRTIEINDDDTEVDLTHAGLEKIEGLEKLHQVVVLCLRRNKIKKIENLESLTTLTELDFYDNLLTEIENVDTLVNLVTLDFSFNKIRKIRNIGTLVKLENLFFVNNKISKIENLASFTNLTMLELGSNRIRKLENLDSLTSLRRLFVGRNKITKLEGIANLKKLEVLSIQSNRLLKIEGLEELVCLQELYISHNGIEKLEGLDQNRYDKFGINKKLDEPLLFEIWKIVNLNTLDVAGNRITRLENISHLNQLEEFWCNDNKVEDWNDLDELKKIKSLETVYLERNPIHYNDTSGYRRKVLLALPELKQLDATLTGK